MTRVLVAKLLAGFVEVAVSASAVLSIEKPASVDVGVRERVNVRVGVCVALNPTHVLLVNIIF